MTVIKVYGTAADGGTPGIDDLTAKFRGGPDRRDASSVGSGERR
jgi:hypothetical protein